jgi:hypothetical protein
MPGARVVAARAEEPFRDVANLCKRAVLTKREHTLLADAGTLKNFGWPPKRYEVDRGRHRGATASVCREADRRSVARHERVAW